MIPAAWFASRVDRIPIPPATGNQIASNLARVALRAAAKHPPFVVMGCAYFVCGMQLVFLTTHLHSSRNSRRLHPRSISINSINNDARASA